MRKYAQITPLKILADNGILAVGF